MRPSDPRDVGLQKTIKESVTLRSPTICSDEVATVTLVPAGPDTGITFFREDLNRFVPVHCKLISNHNIVKWTCLEFGGVRIEATEHVLSAAAGMGVDNMTIRLDGPAVPLMDGSALPFVKAILRAGIAIDLVRQRRSYVDEPVILFDDMIDFRSGDKTSRESSLVVLPGNTMRASYFLRYHGTALQDQWVEFDVTPEVFANKIAPARTFMTPWEIERWGPRGSGMLSKYFCDIVPIVSDTETFEERIPNEAAAHKVLDMIGDLAILGPIGGSFVGMRSGHSLNNEMVRRLWEK